jgi:membrane protease YdiL (CAAX protease family)
MPTLAERSRGFGPVGLLTWLVLLLGDVLLIPLRGLLVLAWARWTETPWRDLGFVRPRSWVRTVVVGVVAGFLLKLFMKSVAMPLMGADPVNQAFHYLTGNKAALPGMLWAVTAGAGFGEETFFRAFLFERLTKLFGSSRPATVAIVLITSAFFAIVHYPGQKLPGVQQAFVVGLVIATIYASTRQIWLPMILHAAFDVTAVGLIYWNLERTVAGWFFH